jgi:hypothetical protein
MICWQYMKPICSPARTSLGWFRCNPAPTPSRTATAAQDAAQRLPDDLLAVFEADLFARPNQLAMVFNFGRRELMNTSRVVAPGRAAELCEFAREITTVGDHLLPLTGSRSRRREPFQFADRGQLECRMTRRHHRDFTRRSALWLLASQPNIQPFADRISGTNHRRDQANRRRAARRTTTTTRQQHPNHHKQQQQRIYRSWPAPNISHIPTISQLPTPSQGTPAKCLPLPATPHHHHAHNANPPTTPKQSLPTETKHHNS